MGFKEDYSASKLIVIFYFQDVALFLQEFNAPDIFMGVLAKSKCPRLRVSMCIFTAASLEQYQQIVLDSLSFFSL